jgi:hypothetical protein
MINFKIRITRATDLKLTSVHYTRSAEGQSTTTIFLSSECSLMNTVEVVSTHCFDSTTAASATNGGENENSFASDGVDDGVSYRSYVNK